MQTLRLGRTRPVDVRSSGSETLLPIRFSAAYTIDTLEYSFRKRWRSASISETSLRAKDRASAAA
jgi:hypothetical protein